MIPNGKGHEAKSEGREPKSKGQRQCHYLGVKKLSALLRGITFKNHGGFYCLNCLHVYKSKDCMKKFCEFLREHAMRSLSLYRRI